MSIDTLKSGPDVIFFSTNVFRSTSQSCGGQQRCRHCTQLHFGRDIQQDQEAARGIWQTASSRCSSWHAWKLDIINQDLHFVSRHQQHHLDARLPVLDSKVFRCCAGYHDLSVHDWKLLDFFPNCCHLLGLWWPKLISKVTSLNYLF